MHVSELRDVAAHTLIVPDADTTMDVGNEIVPSRHLLMEFVFAGIPVRRDVGVGRREDDQNLIVIGNLRPDRVFTGDMAIEDALVALERSSSKGVWFRVEGVVAVGGQDTKRVLFDKIEKAF
ncbi:hypothetical protein GCM10007880_57870 [Mesorhizobium amorphae]|nr:hypothetical protein GCM10007880_57870 [Mesorhizobium amorphae]